MNKLQFFVVLLCCFGMAFHAQAQQVKFYNINIVDVEKGEVVPEMTVQVENGIITQIEKAKKRIKKGEIDLTGKYMMPGLIDSHSHWGSFGAIPKFMTSMTQSYLRDGVTTVRDAGGGMPAMKRYEEQLDSGLVVGPTVYASSFWHGPGYPGGEGGDKPWSRVITDTMSDARLEQLIIEAKEYGCTGLKLYNDISYATLKRIIPLCHKHGVKPWGHFSTIPATAMEVVQAGVETVSHAYLIEGIDGHLPEVCAARFSQEKRAERDSLYAEMIRRGTILDATTKVCVLNDIQTNAIFTREAYKAGVTIAAGTDFVEMKGDTLNSIFLDELNFLADSCGMSIPDVLRAATSVGAKVVGQEGKIGVIHEGAEADFLILNSNPLESLDALQQKKLLYIDGKKVDVD